MNNDKGIRITPKEVPISEIHCLINLKDITITLFYDSWLLVLSKVKAQNFKYLLCELLELVRKFINFHFVTSNLVLKMPY